MSTVQGMDSAGALADLVAAYMDLKPEEKQEILETLDLMPRLDKVSRLLAHRLEVLRLYAEIGQQTQASLDAAPARGSAARADGGDPAPARRGGRQGRELEELTEAIAKAGMPAEVEAAARKELRRLERMPEASAEHGMIRTYLDWLIELPWALPEETPIDIAEARRDARRGPFRTGEDQAAHRGIPGGAQAGAAGQGADPLLRRPARRRQDLARPVDRPRHGTEVRPRQPRRRA